MAALALRPRSWSLLGLGAALRRAERRAGAARSGADSRSAAAAARGDGRCSCCALLVLGVAVPAAVIAAVEQPTTRSRRPASATSRPREKHGRELFGQRCTQLPHAGGGQRGRAGRPEPRPAAPAEGARARRDQERPRQRQRPDGGRLVEGQDAEAVAQFVAVAVGNEPSRAPARPARRRSPRSLAEHCRGAALAFRRSVRNHVLRRSVRCRPTLEDVMNARPCRVSAAATMPRPHPLNSLSETGKRGTQVVGANRPMLGVAPLFRREPVS